MGFSKWSEIYPLLGYLLFLWFLVKKYVLQMWYITEEENSLKHCTLDLTEEYLYYWNWGNHCAVIIPLGSQKPWVCVDHNSQDGQEVGAFSSLCQHRSEGTSRIFGSYFSFSSFPTMCFMRARTSYTFKTDTSYIEAWTWIFWYHFPFW